MNHSWIICNFLLSKVTYRHVYRKVKQMYQYRYMHCFVQALPLLYYSSVTVECWQFFLSSFNRHTISSCCSISGCWHRQFHNTTFVLAQHRLVHHLGICRTAVSRGFRQYDCTQRNSIQNVQTQACFCWVIKTTNSQVRRYCYSTVKV